MKVLRMTGSMKNALILSIVLPALVSQGGGCGNADSEADEDAASPWYSPDPLGRETEGNILADAPDMVIITSQELAAAWEPYALYRSMAGIKTDVVTVESVVEENDGVDDAEKLRNFLAAAYASGLRFALMGGDAEVVPFRRVEDHFEDPFLGEYSTNGPVQLYFADLDAVWDRDGDGVWGESEEDLSLQDMRQPEIAVGRVPASDGEDVRRYFRKVQTYETQPGGKETWPLLLSDVAGDIPLLGTVDSAEALEITYEEFFPEEFKVNARKLYATEEAAEAYGGEVATPGKIGAALLDGYLLAYHLGHGDHSILTLEIDMQFVNALTNELPPIFFSCACLSGNFADIGDAPLYENWTEMDSGDDSAAENLITGNYGAVAYIGNTGVGLGPIGGAQFLHSMFEDIFEEGIRRIGEAFNYARGRFHDVALNVRGISLNVWDESERWTQLVVILLGDPSMAVWGSSCREISVESPEDYTAGYNEMTVRVVTASNREPVEGATAVLHKPGDFLIRLETDAAGTAVFHFVPYGPADMTLTVTGPDMLPRSLTIRPVDQPP
jgi:hypothetical protein